MCSIDGEEVAYDDIAKGFETEDGDMVVLTEEDFADLPSKSSKEIAVEKFVPAEQIDPMLLDKSYYLEPDKAAAKAYVLLRDALTRENRMAIVTVSLRTRMTMAVLRVRDGVIVMQFSFRVGSGGVRWGRARCRPGARCRCPAARRTHPCRRGGSS